jgi:hypothetical protein
LKVCEKSERKVCQEAHHKMSVSSFELNGPKISAADHSTFQSASPVASLLWLQLQPSYQHVCHSEKLWEHSHLPYPQLDVFFPLIGSE